MCFLPEFKITIMLAHEVSILERSKFNLGYIKLRDGTEK